MRTMLTAVLLAGAIASTALGDDGDFQWQGQLAPGQLIEVRGVFGAIRAEGTTDGTASVTAHKTATNSDPATVNIQVAPFDGGVVVCAMYPDANPNHPNNCNPPGMNAYMSVSDNDVQVEFTIKVPLGVQFTGRTLRGDIQAISLTGDVNVTTGIGGITISTTGNAQATTRNGSITAAIGSVAWNGVRFFETGNGNIDLQIPADASVSVRASAIHGTVVSDFALNISTLPHGNISFASGTLGKDDRSLLLSTTNGSIALRQGPSSGQ